MADVISEVKRVRHSRMYYVWCDESDSEGAFYSNFYGGILVRSLDLPYVLNRLEGKVKELGIDREEIKWQKVNKRMFEPYAALVDLIFDLLEEDRMKIRIFFRHNRYVPKYLSRQQMNEEYSLLYLFNVGVSTGFEEPFEVWTQAYRHWSFIPREHEIDDSRTKSRKGNKIENSPVQSTE